MVHTLDHPASSPASACLITRLASTSTMITFRDRSGSSWRRRRRPSLQAPVRCAAGSEREMNYGLVSLAAPHAASSTGVLADRSARARHRFPVIVFRPFRRKMLLRIGLDGSRRLRTHAADRASAVRRRTTVSRTFAAGHCHGSGHTSPWRRSNRPALRHQGQAGRPAGAPGQVPLLANPPLRTDAEAITNNEHPNHHSGLPRIALSSCRIAPAPAVPRTNRRSTRSISGDDLQAHAHRAKTHRQRSLLDSRGPIINSAPALRRR